MSSQRIVDLRGGRPQPRREAPRPSRAPSRRPSLRTRRRKTRAFVILVVLTALAGVLYGVHALSYLSRFTIQRVVVVGAEKMPTDTVVAYADSLLDDGTFHFLSRRNILLYPKSALAAAVAKNFPRVASASLTRESILSTTLTVALAERQPFALWCTSSHPETSDTCSVMDGQGYIFAQNSEDDRPGSSYRFSGGVTPSAEIGSVFAPGHFPGILAMMKLLSNAGYHPEGATLKDDQDFSISLHEGLFLKASYGEDPDILVKNLQLVLTSDALRGKMAELDYIDLRFGDRVYYKFKGQAETSAQ